jgi:hypothetical protein
VTGHRSFFLDEALDGYVQAHSPAVDDVQQSLIGATAALGPLAPHLILGRVTRRLP